MSSKIEINIGSMGLTNAMDEDSDFIPIIADEDESAIDEFVVPDSLPILPLRNTVLFPGVVIPITVGREKSLKLVREVYANKGLLGAVSQIDYEVEEPEVDDMNKIGTVAQIIKILEMPDGTTTVILQGKKRFEIEEMISTEPYHVAKIKTLKDIRPEKEDNEFKALVGSIKDIAIKVIKLTPQLPNEATFAIKNIEGSSFLINFISSNSEMKLSKKQGLLEIDTLQGRAMKLLKVLSAEVQILELKDDIQSKVKTDMDQQQREYLLHQQMKTIQDELGGNPGEEDVMELEGKALEKLWSDDVAEVFEKELKKLQRLNPQAAEYSVQLNYLQEMTDLPWNEFTKDNFDLKNAQSVLDSDHFGLEKVKDRIIEHLAVLKLKGDLKSPILCLYGPPGVGKTSLGKSIAKALDRKYIRMSLGGLHDEAEIRGHRKTYIGAMPGRIIQGIKKAKSSNPVFILDEIDKVGSDHRGDPSSALLEVLDPEQNSSFHDNYLDVDFDLSKVMFIATANNVGAIEAPLRDRMEMIDVSGYITEEKTEIGKRHLIPKQLKNHGLTKKDVTISNDVIVHIIENYTRESGVRGLDQKLAKLMRGVAKKVAMEDTYEKAIKVEDLKEYLGAELFNRDKYQGNEFAGVVTGLAWTSVGGEILYVESSLSPGKGKLTLTGNLGDVMKESALLAQEYLRAHAAKLDIDQEAFDKWNLHVHVPEGAIPKDGPSAGVTMITSIASAFTQRKVRKNLAMTGEITLRGKVLPVGGVREKILAAKRAGIKEIILCHENERDIDEIKPIYLKGLKFHYVEDVMDVLDIALMKQKVKDFIKI
ncbi:endopeptidase La [Ancylomarina sp. 16SWW S1-10-2]|uniref:endopeptidase La n=1 Tax=Ancylomarina sp. 16SWW S1-10-2 TaxID=2499681 RepID=UPI0012AD8324|nr:endopeptidase La [Ancylomarina sp. 16SWW S1-10-2]MRT91537.1 endopeptidase La [Ancylomarina sp. 16SWW S1-10-2]